METRLTILGQSLVAPSTPCSTDPQLNILFGRLHQLRDEHRQRSSSLAPTFKGEFYSLLGEYEALNSALNHVK
jgi:hypothetical protein